MTIKARIAFAAAAVSLALAGAAPAVADSFSADQREEIGKIIKDYLITHPDVMQDVMAELEKRQQAAEAEKHRAAVVENKATLFSSPHQVVLGNPQGNVTMVEFFDYNCGFCKRAMSDMLDLIKTDSNLKFVLKEFPVLGEGSVEAARVAVAARMQDASGKKYIEFHQKLLGGRGAADKMRALAVAKEFPVLGEGSVEAARVAVAARMQDASGKKYIEFHQKLLGGRGGADKMRALAVAKEVGFDMPRLERDMGSDEVKKTIEENMKLAEALGVSGTPSYVVGEEVVIGAVGLDALREKISAERK